MTIALGILASDGVVLAADTQYSWGQDSKTSGSKMWMRNSPGGALAITGAGNPIYLESLAQRFERAFDSNESAPLDDLEQLFERILIDFHESHILPFAHLPDSPDISVVVAVERKTERRLWISEKNVLKPSGPHALVGAGASYGTALLSSLFQGWGCSGIPTCVAERIAVYVVLRVKDYVQGCGKGTHLVRLRDSVASYIDAPKLQILEYRFQNLDELQVLGLKYVLGYPLSDKSKALESLRNYYALLRSDLV